MLYIVIYANDQSSFVQSKIELDKLKLTSTTIVWCDSRRETRETFINKNSMRWLLFLDHDCSIDSHAVAVTHELINKNTSSQSVIFSGLYINSSKSHYLQKAHNFIANTWLQQSYHFAESDRLIIGGIFLIYSAQQITGSSRDVLFWGSEDKALAHSAASSGYVINYIKELHAIHNTNSSFKHFVRRAYMHGINDIKYIKKNRNNFNCFFWIRSIGFANLNLLPIILLHFCIQRAAKLIQKVHR